MKHILTIICICLMPFAAQAFRVTNLSDSPATFEVQQGDRQIERVSVAAGKTFIRSSGVPARIRVVGQGSFSHIAYRDHYALWPDGTFGPQFRRKRGGRD